jgi:D-xylose transport system substrate-binding protein
MLRKPSLKLIALGVVSLVLISGCSASKSTSTASDASTASKGRVCVILPDSASSPIWENVHRPVLKAGFEAAGYTADIQNANGDTNKFATIGAQQLSSGCKLMLIVDLEGAGIQVAAKAKAQGIPVIALDRPMVGADYFVSYDNYKIGQIQGQLVADALKAEGKDISKMNVVYVGGDPTDGTVKLLSGGANQALTAAGLVKPAGETQGTWDGAKAGTYFEQMYTRLNGKVDGVWVANDTNAAAVITILDKYGKKIPVSGQDSTDAGLQNVLLGKQSGTVNTSGHAEPLAAIAAGVDILTGKVPAFTEKQDGVPFIKVDPQVVHAETIKELIASGQVLAANLCTTPELKTACTKYGVK